MGRRVLAPPALVGLIAAAAIAGCGSSTSTTTTTVASAAAAGGTSTTGTRVSVRQVLEHGNAVAVVAQTPISKADFDHWQSVTSALSDSKTTGEALKNQVMGFLITSEWVFGEAAAMKVSVSTAELQQRLAQLEHQSFPKPGAFAAYLAKAKETKADVLKRIKVEMLESKISKRVTAGKTGSAMHAALSAFQKSFETRWRSRTSCNPAYVMEDCKEFKGTPHPQTASSSAASSSSASGSSSAGGSAGSSAASGSAAGSSAPHATSTAASPNASGEVYSSPGSMSLSSPAFERNAEIPAKYTCDGADVSPPLQWQNLPAHTAELVLFVIDDSTEGAEGGIRWVVAGLEPSLSGIAANSLPSGALVGLNGAHKATYGGICPPKGKPATIEFILWALSKKISLSSGFAPGLAESEYSKSELGSAVTYAVYQRS
jgi:Raf kinase inhibitor-like YbhB/YbcL family protein